MTLPSLTLPDGTTVPILGQGTWNMGDDASTRAEEIATLRTGIELGMTLIDTAEMYGNGRSESLVGEAIAGIRDEVFLVDKVLPSNASRRGTVEACERSLQALGTDRIDLYLLHWPGHHALDETVAGFEELVDRGLIGAWGVSNFDTDEVGDMPAECQVDQILYNPTRRGCEWALLPALAERHIASMAYSPIEQGRLLGNTTLGLIAAEHDATVAQIALAWTIRTGEVIAIPKASTAQHVRENAAAAEITLTERDLVAIDEAFPPPGDASPLEML